MYSNANKNCDLYTLICLVENESQVDLDGDFYNNSWFAKPETLGDVAYLQIFSIIQKKVKEISLDERLHENDLVFQNKYDKFMNDLNKNKLIEKICHYLISGSNSKKDVSILILSELSLCQRVVKIFSCEAYIQLFIDHAKSFKKISKIIFLNFPLFSFILFLFYFYFFRIQKL